MAKTEKVYTAITVDKDLYEQLRVLAIKQHRSISGQVNAILEEYLKGVTKCTEN